MCTTLQKILPSLTNITAEYSLFFYIKIPGYQEKLTLKNVPSLIIFWYEQSVVYCNFYHTQEQMQYHYSAVSIVTGLWVG
jgi:hypothetical protein